MSGHGFDWVQAWACLRLVVFLAFAALLVVMALVFVAGDRIDAWRRKRRHR